MIGPRSRLSRRVAGVLRLKVVMAAQVASRWSLAKNGNSMEAIAMCVRTRCGAVKMPFLLISAVVGIFCLYLAAFMIVRHYHGQGGQIEATQRASQKGPGERVSELSAERLPEGMQAVSVNILADSKLGASPLYPGCVVDVIVHHQSGGNASDSSIQRTLLKGIKVLAISNLSRDLKRKKVSLLVMPRQAEALTEAQETGNLSLVPLNPITKLR